MCIDRMMNMMSTESMSIELKAIRLQLEKVINILKVSFAKQMAETKKSVLTSETRKQVYDLSDGQHTVSQIADELGVTQPTISHHLHAMEEVGLVSFEEKEGKKFYYRTLE